GLLLRAPLDAGRHADAGQGAEIVEAAAPVDVVLDALEAGVARVVARLAGVRGRAAGEGDPEAVGRVGLDRDRAAVEGRGHRGRARARRVGGAEDRDLDRDALGVPAVEGGR